MDNTKTIVDVRTKMECFIDKIEGSINIPLDQVPNQIEEIRAMQPVVIYCAAGVRSAQAVSFLKQEGLIEVYDGGGINVGRVAAKAIENGIITHEKKDKMKQDKIRSDEMGPDKIRHDKII